MNKVCLEWLMTELDLDNNISWESDISLGQSPHSFSPFTIDNPHCLVEIFVLFTIYTNHIFSTLSYKQHPK